MPDPGEALVTATSGIFRELGAHLGEKPNDQSGTLCDGTRYNVLAKRRSILLVWTGPADNEGVVGFRITAASSALSGFSQSSAHFTPNRDLHPPAHVPIAASGADGGGAERYLRYTKIVIHGWLSSIAWLVMIPAGMWAARYARLPPHVAPESIHRSSVTSSIRLAWLKLHIWLNAIGLAFAFTGALHSYSALHARRQTCRAHRFRTRLCSNGSSKLSLFLWLSTQLFNISIHIPSSTSLAHMFFDSYARAVLFRRAV